MSDHNQASVATSLAAKRFLGIDTPLGPGAVTLLSLDGEDVLSRCFLYRVRIVTGETDAAIQSLLGMPVTLYLTSNDPDRRRPINGHVRRIVDDGNDQHGNLLYRMEIVPRLWFLSCTADCRLYQNQTVPDILRSVLLDQGLTDFEFRVVPGDYKPVDYCVQYRESALNFVSRLMEHLGLFYWHEHSANKHLLVIGDRNAAANPCDPPTLHVTTYAQTDELRSLRFDRSFRPGKWTLNDFDFESVTKKLLVNTSTVLNVPRMSDHEIYEYPGYFKDQDTGRQLSRLRMEMEESHQVRAFGSSGCVGFDPGRRVTIAGAPDERHADYLLTEVRHRATSTGVEAGQGEGPSYVNEYVAIPADRPFRPERLTPKPFMRGIQTATVVGPAGETIHCDQYGRVRVQFHWDRRGQRDEHSSCWIRVSQHSAGSHWGAVSIPHVGHEVVVSFLEGDPDRPLVTGRTHNSDTMPPLQLPDDKHKTVIRDHGDNKMVFHGKPGQEYVGFYTPRHFNTVVGFSGVKSLSAAASGDFLPNFMEGSGIPIIDDQTETFGGATASIDPYMDPSGFASVAALTSSPSATVGDSNSAVSGKANFLCLGNDNTWCGGNYNEWVGKNYYFSVQGISATSIALTNTTEVGVNNDTWVGGMNSSFVLGANMSIVLGALNFSMVAAPNVSISLAGSASVTVPDDMAVATNRITLLENELKVAQSRINSAQVRIGLAETEITSVQASIKELEVDMITAELQIEDTATALANNGISIWS